MSDVGNPRDHLANERTHLAWVRTALAVIVLGLAVAKFGDGGEASGATLLAGAVLAAAGTAGGVYGSVRYRSTARELSEGRFDTPRSTTGPVAAAGLILLAVVVAGVILIVAGL
jgi:uncharacterized membrane protein YidH (DUF202 family)